MDALQVTEQHDENRQTDCRFGRCNGQDEEDENLPGQILHVMRKGDEVHIHREQQQLDRHQDDDQVFPVEENADDADRKQDRA